ncbi:MAG: NUDIX hydrolase [Gemmatimonadota bacterium]
MPERLLETDPRFWILSEALASYASDPQDPPISGKDVLEAAVSLVLRGTDPLELLFIQRARAEGDPWSGHMALPGGRRDPGDASLLDTAVRETREEVGLDLERYAVKLGDLDPVAPGSTRLPHLIITPFVFGTRPEVRATADSKEVDRVFWVPLAYLQDPANISDVEIALPGGTRSFPCIRVGGEPVWGLTYRILTQFLERLPEKEFNRSLEEGERPPL